VIEFQPRLLLRIGRSTAAVSFLFHIYLPTALGEVSTVIGGVRPFVFFLFFNQLIFDLNFFAHVCSSPEIESRGFKSRSVLGLAV